MRQWLEIATTIKHLKREELSLYAKHWHELAPDLLEHYGRIPTNASDLNACIKALSPTSRFAGALGKTYHDLFAGFALRAFAGDKTDPIVKPSGKTQEQLEKEKEQELAIASFLKKTQK